MAISSTGLGSGLDVETIVSKLVTLERTPITQLQTEKKDLDAQVSAFGKVSSYLSTLRDAARKLTNASTWSATTVASDLASVAATVGDAAVPGSYSVSVSKLAAAQAAASKSFSAATAMVGAGTMTIALGSWDDPPTAFTAKTGATPVSVTVTATDTLETIRDKINASGVGVTASIVTDSTGARLSVRSTDSGVENAFRISVADDDGNSADDAGLSALAYDPPNAAGGMARKQVASNAEAKINGIDIVSASNTLADVMDGLTLKLTKTTVVNGVDSPATVTVSTDTESIKTAVTAFATAYNELNKYLRSSTAYNAETKTAGTLQGDRTAVGLLSQMRSLVSGTSAASSVFGRLADIGLSIQKDGTIDVSSSKLSSAMGKLGELKKMFSAIDSTEGSTKQSEDHGFGQQMRIFVDGLLGTDGMVETRTSGLNDAITRNTKRQEALETRVTAYEKRVRAQYEQLDTKMSSLSALSSYVSQQVSAWT